MLCELITEEEYEETYLVELIAEDVKMYSLKVQGEEVCAIEKTESAFVIEVSDNEAEGKLLTRCC